MLGIRPTSSTQPLVGLQRVKENAKETAHYDWVLVVTELFNITVSNLDAK